MKASNIFQHRRGLMIRSGKRVVNRQQRLYLPLQMHLRTTSEAAQSTSRKRQMNKGRKRGEKMVRRLSEKEEESEELCGRQ